MLLRRQPQADRVQRSLSRDVRHSARQGRPRHAADGHRRSALRSGKLSRHVAGRISALALQRCGRQRSQGQHRRVEERQDHQDPASPDARPRLGRHPRRHHRAAAGRGQDRAHGPPRCADRSRQPRVAERAARAGSHPLPWRADGGGASPRSRSVQGGERHLRSSRRRQAAQDRRRSLACSWCARPTPSPGWAATNSSSSRRRSPIPRKRPALAQQIIAWISEPYRHRRAAGDGRHQHRHRGQPGRRRCARQAAAERRPCAVPRQGRWPRHVPILRARDERADADPPHHGAGPAQGADSRRVRALLPAGGESGEQRDLRLRGADPLESSGARTNTALDLHSAGGRDRLHRASRRMGHPARPAVPPRDGRSISTSPSIFRLPSSAAPA